eukprot:1159258-Pelagomonas_calceolata.AAC.9
MGYKDPNIHTYMAAHDDFIRPPCGACTVGSAPADTGAIHKLQGRPPYLEKEALQSGGVKCGACTVGSALADTGVIHKFQGRLPYVATEVLRSGGVNCGACTVGNAPTDTGVIHKL